MKELNFDDIQTELESIIGFLQDEAYPAAIIDLMMLKDRVDEQILKECECEADEDEQLEYKGYTASIKYSQTDKCFFAKIEDIDDLVTFEASNAQELENNFYSAVDEYITTCKELKR